MPNQSTSARTALWPFVLAMAVVVVSSNILVQYPVGGSIGAVSLADLLTYGAFTYPVAFLVNDLTNRRLGPAVARRVVLVGFVFAVLLSIVLATPRIAIASGTAFLAAHLLDIQIFDRLRRAGWWKAPLISSIVGSLLDTVLFFFLAFSPAVVALGANDPFAIEHAPLLGAFAPDVPRYVSWGLGDLAVKLAVALALVLPYRLIIGRMRGPDPAPGQPA